MWNWLPLAFFKTQQIWIELSCQTLCKQIFSQYSECSFFITYRLQSPTEYKFSPHLPHFKNDPRGAFIVRWSVLEKGLVRWIIGWWVRVLWCRSVDIISPWLLLKGKKVIHLVQKRCAHLSGRPCLLLFSPLSPSNGEQVSPDNLLCLPMWSSGCYYHSESHIDGSLSYLIKGVVHSKMTILSSFTHIQVIPNLKPKKKRYFEECW